MNHEHDAPVVESSGDGDGGTRTVDYDAVEVSSKPPTEYHFTERRAELLRIVREKGSPRAVDQDELADRYRVSQQQISKDLDRLGSYISEVLGDRRLLETHSVVTRAIDEMLEADDWRAKKAAGDLALDLDEWYRDEADLADLQAQLDRIEVAAERQAGGRA